MLAMNPLSYLVALLLLLVTLSSAASPLAPPHGIVNGYCTGTTTADPCPLDVVASSTSLINSISVASYRLASTGLLQPCSTRTPTCAFPVDVEEFNHNLTTLTNTSLLVTPLVFDNDGATVASFRAMLNQSHSQANIDYLTGAAVRLGYSGVSMDWEPSCWEKEPGECEWPTVAEAGAYVDWLTQLSHAMTAKGLPLTVCADHEVCAVQCEGDGYLQHCGANASWTMAQCNCCAFQVRITRTRSLREQAA